MLHPDGDILPNDDTAEVLAVEADLGEGATLTFINVYVPSASSWPRNYVPDFEAVLEDREDQMVLGNFNAHHTSWFPRKGNDRAAPRRDALDEAVNSS